MEPMELALATYALAQRVLAGEPVSGADLRAHLNRPRGHKEIPTSHAWPDGVTCMPRLTYTRILRDRNRVPVATEYQISIGPPPYIYVEVPL